MQTTRITNYDKTADQFGAGIGLGASYFFGDHFNGSSAGVDMRFQF